MKRAETAWYILLLLLTASCKSKDKPAVDSNNIFLDYQVHATEGDDNLTVLLQFREENKEGDGLKMGPEGTVILDGERLIADSVKLGGYFYETHKPIDSFAGKHNVVLSFDHQPGSSEQFEFEPLKLLTPFPDTVQRGEIELFFEGLKVGDEVRILLTDTSFINDGVNKLEEVYKNNELIIDAANFKQISNGPVQLELIREYEKSIKKNGREKGRLLMTYTIRREFWLKD